MERPLLVRPPLSPSQTYRCWLYRVGFYCDCCFPVVFCGPYVYIHIYFFDDPYSRKLKHIILRRLRLGTSSSISTYQNFISIFSLTYLSPFIFASVAAVICGPLENYITRRMCKANNGLFEPGTISASTTEICI